MTANSLIISLGIWRAVLALPGAELPYHFSVMQADGRYRIEIHNGDERIAVEDIQTRGDSVVMRFPVYDSEIRARVWPDSMSGSWINHARLANRNISFYANLGDPRRFLTAAAELESKASGQWPVTFSPGTADSSSAIGLFNRSGTALYGTFLTTSGDYRYLEGIETADSLFLSCFDGAHAFLFKARIEGDAINGLFFSGNHWKENWKGRRDSQATLPHADSLTFLNPGIEALEFVFPDPDGKIVSWSDPAFRRKVKVVQVLGTWCPNCIDESAFLAEAYKKYPHSDFEIIGLAFEKTNNFDKAAANVKKLKEKMGLTYPVLIAGSRDEARATMSMIDRLKAYPTTFFIDRNDKVRKIHTGFYGPATGGYYEKFSDDFHALIRLLLSE